jgi:hypothetical protein
MSRRALQVVLGVGGAVAVVTGLLQIATGPATLPGSPEAGDTVDSELRFLSAFWVALGTVLLWIVPQVERQATVLRAAMAALFLGGVARAVSWMSVGEPHSLAIVLMAIELIAPPIVVAWQATLARRRGGEG